MKAGEQSDCKVKKSFTEGVTVETLFNSAVTRNENRTKLLKISI